MKIKTRIAQISAKLTRLGLVIAGRRGTQLTGTVALTIDKDFIKNTDKPSHIFSVSGTNGKTTMSNMMIDTLKVMNILSMDNHFGSNTKRGIASVFANHMKVFGQSPDYCVLEQDELSMRLIRDEIESESFTVTNIYQDSSDRNANVFFIFNRMNQGIHKNSKLILNATDPISSRLGFDSNEKVFYTVEPLDGEEEENDSTIQDLIYCPECGSKLEWDFHRYHHIGKYHCSHCDFKMPPVDYAVTSISREENILHISDHEKALDLPMISPSMENIYNQIAAYATLRENGFSEEDLVKAMGLIHITNLREEKFEIGNKDVYCLVAKAKNAVATSRVFDRIRKTQGPVTVIYTPTDEASGLNETNFSWLYEVDFQYLKNVDQIIFHNKFSADARLAALLKDIDPRRLHVAENEEEIINYIDPEKKETVYILTYIIDESLNQGRRIKDYIQDLVGEAK